MAAWFGSWLRYLARRRLAPFVPSPESVADKMLHLADLQKGEVVLDLGCGDGRLLRKAVSLGASRGIGYELDGNLVAAARAAAGADERVIVHQECIQSAGSAISEADVVTLYLTESGNAKVLPLLRESLREGSRVVSYAWGMPNIPPTRSATATGPGVVVSFPNILLWERADLLERQPEVQLDDTAAENVLLLVACSDTRRTRPRTRPAHHGPRGAGARRQHERGKQAACGHYLYRQTAVGRVTRRAGLFSSSDTLERVRSRLHPRSCMCIWILAYLYM
jgi:SAM-dependent methyltransferase